MSSVGRDFHDAEDEWEPDYDSEDLALDPLEEPEWLNNASTYFQEIAGLCKACQGLNLEPRFHRAYDLYEGARRGQNTRKLKVYRSYDDGPPYLADFYYVTSLGDRLSRESTCRLCTFLRETIADPENGTYKLLAFCSTESYIFEAPQNDKRGWRPWGLWDHNVFMAVVPEVPGIPKTGVPLRWCETDLPKCGSIYRLTTPEEREDKTRVTIPNRVRREVDWYVLEYWLEYCRGVHQFCKPKKPAGASLPGFHAINCTKTPPVVEERPWAGKYVALSYVWGPPSGDWPQTTLDAVEVTKRLGEKYLWVDRLCIDQSNAQEKQFLISKMDAIYEGAEFTIIAASGDARTGLPGVGKTPRAEQPIIDLRKRQTLPGDYAYTDNCDDLDLGSDEEAYTLLGIFKEELMERSKDGEWLDTHRFGFRSRDRPDFAEMMKEIRLREKYMVSEEHFRIFQRFAEDQNYPIDEWMVKMEKMSQRRKVPLQELAPLILREISASAGAPPGAVATAEAIPKVVTSSDKPKANLPKISGNYVTLVSTMEDPRITIRNSEWATRGWTYQEGVLSNRRLVFTEKQAYWECCGMAVQESLELPMSLLYRPDNKQMPHWCLSGIFDGDFHRVPEPQYGFKPANAEEVFEQVQKLNSHINAFTSRNLSYNSDSLNAFLGVAARYSVNDGLALLMGMPVWTGVFANGKPGLHATFALSISTWAHDGRCLEQDSGRYVADCARRDDFPSWTWVGWKGSVGFGHSAHAEDDPTEPFGWSNGLHVDFFEAMTDKGWVDATNRSVWYADMLVHSSDGSEPSLLTSWAPVRSMAVDQSKTWLLTICKPLIVQPKYLSHSEMEGERRKELHISVPMTMEELEAGHRNGHLVTVLVFMGMAPRIFQGAVRCLLLRRAGNGSKGWERIGRLAVTIEEWAMNKYKSTSDRIAALPVANFGEDIVIS